MKRITWLNIILACTGFIFRDLNRDYCIEQICGAGARKLINRIDNSIIWNLVVKRYYYLRVNAGIFSADPRLEIYESYQIDFHIIPIFLVSFNVSFGTVPSISQERNVFLKLHQISWKIKTKHLNEKILKKDPTNRLAVKWPLHINTLRIETSQTARGRGRLRPNLSFHPFFRTRMTQVHVVITSGNISVGTNKNLQSISQK